MVARYLAFFAMVGLYCDFKFGFVGAKHRNNVGRDDLGTPWQESQW